MDMDAPAKQVNDSKMKTVVKFEIELDLPCMVLDLV